MEFDDVSFAQTFVLQPLIFLGGVFYSASLLPEQERPALLWTIKVDATGEGTREAAP